MRLPVGESSPRIIKETDQIDVKLRASSPRKWVGFVTPLLFSTTFVVRADPLSFFGGEGPKALTP